MCPVCAQTLVAVKNEKKIYKQCPDCGRAWEVPFIDSRITPRMRVA